MRSGFKITNKDFYKYKLDILNRKKLFNRMLEDISIEDINRINELTETTQVTFTIDDENVEKFERIANKKQFFLYMLEQNEVQQNDNHN